MTDVETLLAVVAAIYLSECVIWLPARCRVVVGIPGHMRRAASPDVLGNEHKQLFVLSLSPIAATLVARQPGCLFCHDGVLLRGTDQAWRLLPFDQITTFEVAVDQERVLIGQHHYHAGTRQAARQIARQIQRLAESPQRSERLAAHLSRYTDPRRAARRIGVMQQRVRVLHQLQFMLLTWSLGAGTFLYYFSTAPWRALAYYLFVLLVLWTATVVIGWRCHRRLHPVGLSARLKELFFSCVSPMHAVRATDRLSLEALGDEHPLAVALAVVSSDRVEEMAREYLAELRHPLTSESIVAGDCSTTRTALQEVREALANALAESLRRSKIDADALSVPDQQDDDAVCWCPRCFNQYTIPMSECPDCSGVGVQTFDTISFPPAQ